MQVVAIKPAFFNGSRIRLGQKLEIPDDTQGNWFALPDDAQAQAAVKIKASGFTPDVVLQRNAMGQPVDLTEHTKRIPVPRTLHAIAFKR